MGGRLFDIKEADELISKRTIGPLDGFRSKMGRPFSAIIKLNNENKTEFDFGQSDSGTGANGDEDIDFSDKTPLGKCPACGEKIYEHGMSYLCEKSVGKEKKCKFRSGKVILQRTIQTEEMKKLLETGRTELLHRFISKKGRPFSAYLVSGKDGKVGFEFEPRKSKTTKKKTAKDSKPKSS
jgi:DNA topoisomerase-3